MPDLLLRVLKRAADCYFGSSAEGAGLRPNRMKLSHATSFTEQAVMDVKGLSDIERERCVEEGRQAAFRNANPFACPYVSDETDQRFSLWIEGYRLGQAEAKISTSLYPDRTMVILDDREIC